MTRAGALYLFLLGCNGGTLSPIDAGPLSDLASADQAVNPADRDGDGIDDDVEGELAIRYLPFLSLAANDDCPVSGLAVRVTPAAMSSFVMIRYAWLFDRECDNVERAGAGGSISVLVDPSLTGAAGIVGMRAIARAGTGCQNISTCGQCLGQLACAAVQGGSVPAVWAGVDSHALYVDRQESCVQTNACAASCTDAAMSAAPPIVNVGEPDRPLVNDLTDEGFITAANGWQSAALMHYDPWGGLPFGAIAAVSDLLNGLAIDPPSCSP